eukprot:3853034-Pyramimonas_sp.AAC.2
MPYFEARGEAAAGLNQSSLRGRVVAWLLNNPSAAFVACQLVCQRRRLWWLLVRLLFATWKILQASLRILAWFASMSVALVASVWAVVLTAALVSRWGGRLRASNDSKGDPSASNRSNPEWDSMVTDNHPMNWVEDCFLHSYRSCQATVDMVDRHRIHDFAVGGDSDLDASPYRFCFAMESSGNTQGNIIVKERSVGPSRGGSGPSSHRPPPVLLLHGSEDVIAPAEQSRLLAKRLHQQVDTYGCSNTQIESTSGLESQVKLVEIPRNTHAMYTNPKQLAATLPHLRQWLCSLEAPQKDP